VVVNPGTISFRQTNPASRTAAYDVTQMVISPLATGDGFLHEIPQTGSMHEFLFEMRKDGAIYWVGVAVPKGTSDFSKAQVFFHPTVEQTHRGKDGKMVVDVHAKATDYPTFSGGWSGSLQRYVAMQGGQLAGARQTTLIVPFMTMAAFTGSAPAYMFATRPVETLNAIMTAVRDAMLPGATEAVALARMGVSSFSSGIGAMQLFIGSFGGSRLIVEVTDFDGPFISSRAKTPTRSPGAVSRVFSQVPPARRELGWLTMGRESLGRINTFRDKGAHGQIGWMTFFVASLSSVIN
jgi:hypothetical protein